MRTIISKKSKVDPALRKQAREQGDTFYKGVSKLKHTGITKLLEVRVISGVRLYLVNQENLPTENGRTSTRS